MARRTQHSISAQQAPSSQQAPSPQAAGASVTEASLKAGSKASPSVRRRIWQSPELHDSDSGRTVNWLELFFDLFFVAVIAELVHSLAADPTLPGLLKFMFLFVPVWWVWVGDTFYTERFETEGVEMRVYIYLLMLPMIGMAVSAHHAMTTSYTGFALSYAAARLVITLMWAWATVASERFRPVGKRYVPTFVLSIILVSLSTLVPAPARLWVFGLGLVIEVLAPLTTVRLQADLPPYSCRKLPKRFGLFTIIVLGEMVIGIVNGLSELDEVSLALFAYVALGVAIGFGLWWLYFDFIGRRQPKQGVWTFVWTYLHLPFVMAIGALSAGITHVVDAQKIIEPNVQTLIGGCVGVILVTLALLELTLQRAADEPTHKTLSPLLKAGTGVLAFVFSFTFLDLYPTTFLVTLSALLLTNMSYGLWVWYKQPIQETSGQATFNPHELPL
ncbi:MAG: low temperature requirement protein A [Deinococcota bacterium]